MHGGLTRYEVQFQPTLPARGATKEVTSMDKTILFQPTLPARGATCYEIKARGRIFISTHAPRTGSDEQVLLLSLCNHIISTHAPRTGSDLRICYIPIGMYHFNPRSPHGERRMQRKNVSTAVLFQPTLPARGATIAGCPRLRNDSISTHAPRTGSDRGRG